MWTLTNSKQLVTSIHVSDHRRECLKNWSRTFVNTGLECFWSCYNLRHDRRRNLLHFPRKRQVLKEFSLFILWNLCAVNLTWLTDSSSRVWSALLKCEEVIGHREQPCLWGRSTGHMKKSELQSFCLCDNRKRREEEETDRGLWENDRTSLPLGFSSLPPFRHSVSTLRPLHPPFTHLSAVYSRKWTNHCFIPADTWPLPFYCGGGRGQHQISP